MEKLGRILLCDGFTDKIKFTSTHTSYRKADNKRNCYPLIEPIVILIVGYRYNMCVLYYFKKIPRYILLVRGSSTHHMRLKSLTTEKRLDV